MKKTELTKLREIFTDRLQENCPLASYTSARIGGPAEALLFARSADELAEIAGILWNMDLKFLLLGGGSNVLVSDKGCQGVVVINRARQIRFDTKADPINARAESGVTLNDLAQRAARFGASGMEWAASVPGSLGGAVYGNAGAFGGEMSGSVAQVEVIHRTDGRQTWPVEQMAYSYRSSILKREHLPVIILAAVIHFLPGDPTQILEKMADFSARRRKNQPAGASMGSTFKNPPGERAGRLIEAAGLKGRRIGNAEISPVHANFIINHGSTSAADVMALINLMRDTVMEKFNIRLEMEIELVGCWEK